MAGVIQAIRMCASMRGLRINWNAATVERKESVRIVVYRDEEPGRNGIVRLAYRDPDLLIALSLSSAP